MRTALAIAASALTGCALLLGGLPEGSSREPPAQASDAGTDASGKRPCWLSGHGFRATFEVEHRGPPVAGYQVKLVLPTAPLIAAGKLRMDGADLRVTLSDGTTVIPHFVEGGLETDATTLWARLDLAAAPTRIHVYYGKADAPDTSTLRDTFVTGVIGDLGLEGEDVWQSFQRGFESDPITRTNEWSATLEGGEARLRIVRKFDENGAAVGYCQTVTFPAGSSYQLFASVDVHFSENASARILLEPGDLDLWCGVCNAHQAPGRFSAATLPLTPGTKTLCLTVGTGASSRGQGIDATYSRLRLRRLVDPEPNVVLRPAEERAPDVEGTCK